MYQPYVVKTAFLSRFMPLCLCWDANPVCVLTFSSQNHVHVNFACTWSCWDVTWNMARIFSLAYSKLGLEVGAKCRGRLKFSVGTYYLVPTSLFGGRGFAKKQNISSWIHTIRKHYHRLYQCGLGKVVLRYSRIVAFMAGHVILNFNCLHVKDAICM